MVVKQKSKKGKKGGGKGGKGSKPKKEKDTRTAEDLDNELVQHMVTARGLVFLLPFWGISLPTVSRQLVKH